MIHSKFSRNSKKWWLILTWKIRKERRCCRFIEELFEQCLEEKRALRKKTMEKKMLSSSEMKWAEEKKSRA